MSNKNPMKFLPPDDPTAVYPIRSAEAEAEPLEPDLSDEAEADENEDPLPKTFEFADDTTAPRATPLPVSSPSEPEAGGLNPLLLVAFLGGGIILAALVLLAIAAVLFLLQ
jgi:hypothetical protein